MDYFGALLLPFGGPVVLFLGVQYVIALIRGA
jgi:hypothetical protein